MQQLPIEKTKAQILVEEALAKKQRGATAPLTVEDEWDMTEESTEEKQNEQED